MDNLNWRNGIKGLITFCVVYNITSRVTTFDAISISKCTAAIVLSQLIIHGIPWLYKKSLQK